METLLFVYGTLKRGYSNHAHLAGQTYVGPARTVPGFTLYDLGGYPGIVADPADRVGVGGEVWRVDSAALAALDQFEGVHEGLYRREPLRLAPPYDAEQVEAYVSALPVLGRPHVGADWIEPRR